MRWQLHTVRAPPPRDSEKSPGSRILDQDPGGPDSSSLCDLGQITVNSLGLRELSWTEGTMMNGVIIFLPH